MSFLFRDTSQIVERCPISHVEGEDFNKQGENASNNSGTNFVIVDVESWHTICRATVPQGTGRT